MKKVAVGESSTQALCVIHINKSWIERDDSAHGAICGRFSSLSTRDTTTPTPSNTPRRIPLAARIVNVRYWRHFFSIGQYHKDLLRLLGLRGCLALAVACISQLTRMQCLSYQQVVHICFTVMY